MKNFAKLMLLFSTSFLSIFLVSTVFRFLSLRVDWAKNLPIKPETTITLLIAAAGWALSLALFASIVFAISYSNRRRFSPLMTILLICSMSFIFCFGITAILENWKTIPPAQASGIPMGDKGLILSRGNTSIILLEGAERPLGPRVVAMPGESLSYQSSASTNFELPPVPFGDDTPWFLRSLAIDLKLNTDMMQQRFSEGIIPFSIHTGSLVFLLCSLGLAIKFSAWPLANLFIKILAFRGVLALEIFLLMPEIQETMASFLKTLMPVSLAVPAIFVCFSLLLHLYSFLIFLTKRRYEDD